MPAPSTAPPPSIQACPALRAARIDPRLSPRVTPRQKRRQDRTQTSPKPIVPESRISASVPHARPPQARQQLYAEGKFAEKYTSQLPRPNGWGLCAATKMNFERPNSACIQLLCSPEYLDIIYSGLIVIFLSNHLIQSPSDSGTFPIYILLAALTRMRYLASVDTILYQGTHEILLCYTNS